MILKEITETLRKIPALNHIIKHNKKLSEFYYTYLLHNKHYSLSNLTYPELLIIALTTRCNLSCWICNREGFKGNDIDFTNIYKLKTAIEHAKAVSLTGWGESFLYSGFKEVVGYIIDVNPNRILQCTTNGTFLNKEYGKLFRGHISKVQISLNSSTPNTYYSDTKKDLNQVIQQIKEFIECLDAKDIDGMWLSFVAHTKNFREAPSFLELAHRIRVKNVTYGNYLASTSERMPYTLYNIKKEWNEIVEKVREEAKRLKISISIRGFGEEVDIYRPACIQPFITAVVGVNGECYPCCSCGNSPIGNVYKDKFETVWFGEKANEIRRKGYLSRCKKCSAHLPLDNLYAHYTAFVE